jgi:hypothetical protein
MREWPVSCRPFVFLRASRREEGGTKMTAYDERPDIMAIGDSMYRGIRSISFLPAMVNHLNALADAIGMSMTLPALRQPLLFDLEAELRRGGLLHLVEHLRGVCIANLKARPLDQPRSQNEAFDNVAIGGAQIDPLFQDT